VIQIAADGAPIAAHVSWTLYPGGDEIAYLRADPVLIGPFGAIHLRFSSAEGATKQETSQLVYLDTTRPFFGGTRPWFICPIESGSEPCGRRVGILYLPPNASHFGCRACWDLTYASCRASHRYDRMFEELARLKPGATAASMRDFLQGAPRWT